MTQSPGSAEWGPGIGPEPATDEEIVLAQIRVAARSGRPGRYVVYPYCISILVMSFKRSSGLVFVSAGSSALVAGLPYLLISLVVGWWGIPWGIFWTIESIWKCLTGGIDVTPLVAAARSDLP